MPLDRDAISELARMCAEGLVDLARARDARLRREEGQRWSHSTPSRGNSRDAIRARYASVVIWSPRSEAIVEAIYQTALTHLEREVMLAVPTTLYGAGELVVLGIGSRNEVGFAWADFESMLRSPSVTGVVLLHTHPASDGALPSPADRRAFRASLARAEAYGKTLVDDLILAARKAEWYSMREDRLYPLDLIALAASNRGRR